MAIANTVLPRLWLLLCCTGTVVAADPPSPQDWLTRMDQALATRNYRGVFEHRQGQQTVSLRIVHRVQEGAVEERVMSLDGSGREFIRRAGELFRYLPDRKLVQVEPSHDTGMLLAELRRVDVAAARQYRMRELPPDVVSGRRVRVILVQPRDRFRYGYQLWIDESSAMPLKTQLLGARGEVLEQLQFTELSLPKVVPDSLLAAETDASSFTWRRNELSTAMPALNTTDASAWQSQQLPPGFRMTVRATQSLPGQTQPVTQLVYSDGLAAVSVFVEQGSTPVAVDSMAADVAMLGSSSAYSTVVKGYRVTAVGEVPPETLRAIANAAVTTPATAVAQRSPPVPVSRPPGALSLSPKR